MVATCICSATCGTLPPRAGARRSPLSSTLVCPESPELRKMERPGGDRRRQGWASVPWGAFDAYAAAAPPVLRTEFGGRLLAPGRWLPMPEHLTKRSPIARCGPGAHHTGVIADVVQLTDASHCGRGLIATTLIPRGTILGFECRFCRTVATRRELTRMAPDRRAALMEHCYLTQDGRVVLDCSIGRYMNHHCRPNVLEDEARELDLVIRDIAPGEPVCCDYRQFHDPLEGEMICRCGARGCCDRLGHPVDRRLRSQWRRWRARAWAAYRARAEREHVGFLLHQVPRSPAISRCSSMLARVRVGRDARCAPSGGGR